MPNYLRCGFKNSSYSTLQKSGIAIDNNNYSFLVLCWRSLLLQAEKADIVVWVSTKYVQQTATDTRIELLKLVRIYTSHTTKGTNWMALQKIQLA
jgi:hypothetical protein